MNGSSSPIDDDRPSVSTADTWPVLKPSMETETRRHWELIRTPPGAEWSGRTRYAAAAFFYDQGDLSAEVLEVYRICARLDEENPLDVLRRWQIGAEWIARMERFE